MRAPAKLSGIALAIALHALAIGLLLQMEPLRTDKQTPPIVVRFVAAPLELKAPDEPPKPRPVVLPAVRPKPVPKPVVKPAPKPKRVVKPRVHPKPAVIPPPQPAVVAALPQAPSTVSASPPPSAPVAEAPPERGATAPAAPAAPPPSLAPPPPARVTPPSFNADYLNNPAPRYPALSRRLGEEGRVVLRVRVNEEGLPTQVQLKTSSGSSRLDSTALEAVKQWKFVPARRGAEPVPAWVLVPISFSLRS